MQRVQRLIKQSKQKDYYKVLGVDRDTDVRTIKKGLYVSPIIIYHAFHSRRASKIAHRAKIAAVNEAPTKFSTIPVRPPLFLPSDPCLHRTLVTDAFIFLELHQRFDNGEDPNDHGGTGRAPLLCEWAASLRAVFPTGYHWQFHFNRGHWAVERV